MNKKSQRRLNNNYYEGVLLQFLGIEKEVENHTEYSLIFFHKGLTYILWPGANKIQIKDTSEWIYDADIFIIDKVLKENSIPYLSSFTVNKTNT